VRTRGVIVPLALAGLSPAAPVAAQVENAPGEDCAGEFGFGTDGALAYGGIRLEY
jgi:hypothetical protein